MTFEEQVLEKVYRLATYFDEVPDDIRRWVENYFRCDRPVSYYQPFLEGIVAAIEVGDWEECPKAFGPPGYLAVCVAHELIARGMLEELLH